MEQLPWNRHLCHLEDDPAGMSHNLGTDLDQFLPQCRQRPVTHRAWQHCLPQVVSQIVSQHKKQQPDLVINEVMAGKPRPPYGILAFLDPLLRRPPLIVKTHHSFFRPAQIGDDESDAREQLPPVPFHFGNHPAETVPTLGLIGKVPIPHLRFFRGVFPPDDPSAVQSFCSRCHWLEAGWHTKSLPLPDTHRCLDWQRRHRPESSSRSLGRDNGRQSVRVLPIFIHRDLRTLLLTGRLWLIVLTVNLVGTWIFASMLQINSTFPPEVVSSLNSLAQHSINHSFWIVVLRAILAGG